MLQNFILVGFGGLIGSVGRYFCSIVISRLYPTVTFPYGTLFVNVLGCFFIGFLGGVGANKQLFAEAGRIFLFTGILGGFTTFSAFGLETFYFIRTSQWSFLFLNVFLQITFGIGAVILGYWLSKFI